MRKNGKHSGLRAVVIVAAVGTLAAACGSSNKSSSGASTTPTTATSAATAGGNSAAWQQLVAQAKQEGQVTIYSSQGLDQLNAVAKAFKSKYGITVNVARNIDATDEAKLSAEESSGKKIADVVSFADSNYVQTNAAWWQAPTGPDFDNPAYDKSTNVQSNGSFVTSAAVYALGWNTQLVPGGLTSYSQVLDPKYKGKIGIPDAATSTVVVDFYGYLQQQAGSDFLTKLSALSPQVFASVLQIAQNLTSGQVAVGLAVAPLVTQKAAGAPVDYIVPKPAWGARFYTVVVRDSPHPAAAQLLADFLVTPDGQAALTAQGASVLPNTPGAVATVANVRAIDPANLQPTHVQQFDAQFKSLFQH